MKSIENFLEKDVGKEYIVRQESILKSFLKKKIEVKEDVGL